MIAWLSLLPALAAPLDDAALCAGLDPCVIASSTPAGTDRQGRPLRIVERQHAPEPTDGSPSYGEACVLREWVLVGGDQPTGRVVHQACNDGYGARGMGQDSVSVEAGAPGRLKASQSGGSSWGWSSGVEVLLDPLTLVSSSQMSWWTLGPQVHDVSLDRRTGARQVAWEHGSCRSGGEGPGSGDLSGRYTVVPQVDAGLGGDWRSLDVAGCAATVGAGEQARMHVLARGETELLVQIRDDVWVDDAASWLHEDHLEIWVGSGLPNPHDNDCVKPVPAPRQWAVRLRASDDQRVIAAHGSPDPTWIQAEVSRVDASTRRVRLVLREAPKAMTVVFSDGDTGTDQSLHATSALRFGQAVSLGGPPEPWREDRGRCTLTERALRWTPTPTPDTGPVTGL